MKGIVLCGGQSTRMGQDKGLLKEEEETWAEIATRKFHALRLPAFISVNDAQYPVYEQIFSGAELLTDNPVFNAKAPLFGLLSAHLQWPDDDLFVLACDMKDITTALLQALLEQHKKEQNEALVYHTGERPQPLCGIYTSGGLKKIYALYQGGKLSRFSMMHVLEVLQTKFIPVNEENGPAFRNYNEPYDL